MTIDVETDCVGTKHACN